MLITFSSRLLAEPHCTDTQLGQAHLVTCPDTGTEYIWSPEEPETCWSAMAEHEAAHRRLEASQERQRRHAAHVAHAQHVYRTTEPGHPARRGIGVYL